MIRITPRKPQIVPDRDGYRNWYVDQAFSVEIVFPNGKQLLLHIAKGYRFDGHSVPWALQFLFPKAKGLDLYAALIHDLLIDLEPFLRVTRKQQDWVYGELMIEYSTNGFRSRFMPRAVKSFGYLKHTIWGDDRGEMKQVTELSVECWH